MKCIKCRSESFNNFLDTLEFEIDGKIFVVENIPCEQCTVCNEKYYDDEANQYIDKQLEIFKADGFENKAKEVTKEKGLTQEQLGELLGVSKQRINQIFKDNNPDVKTMIKISKAINEPIQNVFSFNRVIKKDNKFYLDRN
ncbi:helix-turn-helix domain-containing protein [Paenibacillus naphthalenovorans]|uniref:Xre family transcriptional regulator n=1 Tax=Paenibacillus naphthalenovorans TaxID=162209 RepID=A0A0U2VS04_9BACL|nr:helix-turn-helix domain-containing protein [Paenibacillus naphthalenovorans]ALS22279.1 Xre family transcriptional regulator [Paenibacillus naphthalenovorans]